MKLFALVLAVQALQGNGSAGYEGRGGPDVPIPRSDAAASVDGLLDEPVWSSAARLIGFSQYEPVDGRPAEDATEVLVWYAPDALWFGIVASDRSPASIRATTAERDRIDGEDHITVYLDTFDDRRRAFFFAVNALGVQQDGVRTEGAASPGRIFGGSIDKNPDFFFESRGRLTDDGYVIEMRIPFKSLRYSADPAQRWGVNIVRRVQRTGHTYTWTDVRRASASFLSQSGTLTGLQDLQRGVVIEVQPTFTVSLPGTRRADGFERGDADPEFGANLRLGFTSLAVDATYNPDFSQVETDEGQVTVNERFALFFPEKRPFFLEGIELFAAPNQLVYTRQIADPIAGGKITGKIGSIGIAHLTAVDENVDAEGREALFNVTRLRRDFGDNSLAGLVFTDRSLLDAQDFNRVVAADTRIVFGGLYYAEAQAGWSWTRAGGTSVDAPIWGAEIDRTGRKWGFNYAIDGIAEDFISRSGFINRNGIVNAHGFNRFSFYGEEGAFIERVTMFFGPTRIWRHNEFAREGAVEGGESATFMTTLRGGWETSIDGGRDFVTLDAADYAAYEVAGTDGIQPYTPLDRVSGGRITASVRTPTFQTADGRIALNRRRTAIFQEGSAGNESGIDLSLNMRPSESLRFSASTSMRRLTRERDGSEFARTIIPRIRAEYQPTRALLFRVIAEHRAERRAALEDARTGAPLLLNGMPAVATETGDFRIDALVSFRPVPGTIAFFGYGSSFAAQEDLAFGDLQRTRDGFFLKLAYQFRR